MSILIRNITKLILTLLHVLRKIAHTRAWKWIIETYNAMELIERQYDREQLSKEKLNKRDRVVSRLV